MNTPRYDLGVIACSASKYPVAAAPAVGLYKGAPFSIAFKHAQQRCDRILIMSAKHGLVWPQQVLPWYDLFIGSLTEGQKKELVEKMREVVASLALKTVLSYLPQAYHELFIQAVPSARISRPYKLKTPTKCAILSREIQGYGKYPQRR